MLLCQPLFWFPTLFVLGNNRPE
uniref:Uncharacterized protein n=1 Tax=Arundo donax TaxID=35708 RepID=A0A0A9GVX5_ARUDO